MVRAILLGTVQGLTEFLPISSSGHLVLADKLLGQNEADLYMQVFLHFGTLLALIIVYHRKLWELLASCGRVIGARKIESDGENLVYVAYLAVATIPAMLVGYFLRGLLGNMYNSVYMVGFFMLATGTIVFLTRFTRRKKDRLILLDPLVIGLAQVFALLPGISRSGITIGAGMFRGLGRDAATDFSFLLAIPSILIVSIYDFCHLSKISTRLIPQYAVGMVFALIVGYFAVRWLLSVVKKGNFHRFSYYCWSVGLLSLILWTARMKGGF